MLVQNLNAGSVAQASQTNVSNVETRSVEAAALQKASVKQADASSPPTAEQLKGAVEAINQVLRQSQHGLEFSVDTDTKMSVVKLVDVDTGELIRQIPSEETLAIARSIDRFQQGQQGLLLRQKA